MIQQTAIFRPGNGLMDDSSAQAVSVVRAATLREERLDHGGGDPAIDADMETITGIVAGETSLFEALVEKYSGLVARIVGGKVPREDAAEVAHEVFIRAYESLPAYKPLKPFGHWLSILAVRTCHDFWRERYRNRETPQASLSDEQKAWLEGLAARENPLGDLEGMETWELLDWAMGHLPADDRLALTLIHLEETSVAEAAELLGWSQSKVKVRAMRARRKLRDIIERELC